jgi:putative lipoprotein
MIDLRGTRWRVEDLAGQGLAGTASIEIAFGADGVLSGSTGVNRFRGPYRLLDDRLTIGPIMTTRMAGPPEGMAQERALLEILARECTVRIEGATLLIDDGRSVTRLTSAESQDADAPPLVVRGSALYRERVAMLPGSTLTVTVEDVSRADAPSVVLAEQRVEDPPNVPIPFELLVDRSAIGPHAELSVRASITQDGTLQWTSDTHHPVPMDGDPEPITVLMVRVGGAVEE